jgi:hypothetical protein
VDAHKAALTEALDTIHAILDAVARDRAPCARCTRGKPKPITREHLSATVRSAVETAVLAFKIKVEQRAALKPERQPSATRVRLPFGERPTPPIHYPERTIERLAEPETVRVEPPVWDVDEITEVGTTAAAVRKQRPLPRGVVRQR